MNEPTPIWTPLANLLKSRKFVLWAATFFAAIAVHFAPFLAGFQAELIGGLFLGVLALTSQITAEDVAKARTATAIAEGTTLADLLHEGIAVGFEELEKLTPQEIAQLKALTAKMRG